MTPPKTAREIATLCRMIERAPFADLFDCLDDLPEFVELRERQGAYLESALRAFGRECWERGRDAAAEECNTYGQALIDAKHEVLRHPGAVLASFVVRIRALKPPKDL